LILESHLDAHALAGEMVRPPRSMVAVVRVRVRWKFEGFERQLGREVFPFANEVSLVFFQAC
jgi:hypothetical protein